ncbi:MAG: glycosyltransferase, partial [Eubacteriales bacterium]
YKGIDILLKAVSMLPEKYRLVVVSNDSQEQINNEIDKFKLTSRVKFYKGVKYQDLPKYYRSADVFCMPSTDRGEAFGLVSVEAMACGTPVITTELGTGTSYHNIDRVTGRVIEKNNPTQLKGAILEICNNKNTYNPRVVRNRAEDFSLDKFKENWSNLLKR